MLFAPRATHRVFIPDGEPPRNGWPVLLFLHGAGERGSDGIAQTTVGLGPAIAREPERFPLLVVFPQCPADGYWRDADLDIALEALQATLDEFACDEGRVYLSGISMGGYGTFSLALREPHRFAAIVPVCGGIARKETNAAERLKHLPAWVFHGDQDAIIPVEESRTIVAALRALGADVRYTEYANVQHNSWTRAYAEPELIPWLLAQNQRTVSLRTSH